jgi:hypothetical protein
MCFIQKNNTNIYDHGVKAIHSRSISGGFYEIWRSQWRYRVAESAWHYNLIDSMVNGNLGNRSRRGRVDFR